MSERSQALKRISYYVVGTIFIFFWRILIRFLSILNLLYTLVMNERNEKIAYFSNLFCAFQYRFERYIAFTTDKDDMFSKLKKGIDPLDMEEW
jgi:hypothetical protein